MSDKEETAFENKCSILAELWIDYRNAEDFIDFISYNDLGLPLAFLVSEKLVTPGERATAMIDETFELLLAAMKIEDAGFETLEELFLD